MLPKKTLIADPNSGNISINLIKRKQKLIEKLKKDNVENIASKKINQVALDNINGAIVLNKKGEVIGGLLKDINAALDST